ncbi:DUF349 domain-containing protein [Cochleicola gelatinilyticus]|uniref:Chromosome segregation protein n=1 Tax=Cochleicola gelatinilyticus TaxID=1763537 RepID=A0A167HDH8_9FLAO|nr:DUF349 domain-containing protein [Cochleicola gelatinilyticus]OAB78503.1 chromosome segregation protein [Cochleicola gelatinilyticus]
MSDNKIPENTENTTPKTPSPEATGPLEKGLKEEAEKASETSKSEAVSEETSDLPKAMLDEASSKTPSDEKEPSKKEVAAPSEEKKEESNSEVKEENTPNSEEENNSDEEDEEEVSSSDDEEESETDDKDEKDYSTLSKKDLIKELETLLKNQPIQTIKNDVEEIRSEFNSKFNEELAQKKEEFLAEGGNIIDFYYSTPIKKEFNTLYFDYKEKRNNYYKSLKKDLQANLEKREALIEELKGLLSAEENINTTYKHFKDIQSRWHEAGAIPRDVYNTVWNTYHHHVENFYDFLHLNREFRDLDFKHNLDQKLKLIIRAEELAEQKDLNKAFRELQMLHKMWKEEIGPVAKEYRDEVWDKFSAATSVIHDKRQAQLQEQEAKFEENLVAKKNLIAKIGEVTENTGSSHKAWQSAMKEVQKMRDAYFEIGKVPRSHNKETWNTFKEATRNFNKAKNTFYKNQKKEQYTNLEKKRELVAVAEKHKDSEDFDTVTPLMKKIQNDWRQIGHVPRKDSDAIWKEFKAACNYYFDRLHAQKNEANKEEVANYEAKIALLEKLDDFKFTGDHKEDLKGIKEQIKSWKEIGRVPYNKRSVEQKFNKALDGMFGKLDLDKKETELIKFDNKLNTLTNRDDDRKLRNEHFFISKKIEETKAEIMQLENNLGFFQHVPDDNPMVKEVHKNINRHKEQLEVWKAKLSKIKSVRETGE